MARKHIKDSPTSLPKLPVQLIERRIYAIRGQNVMLSPDLADLYQVEPRALVQAVKRNLDRFPEDFMFQLTKEEDANLKSQIVTSSWGGARRATPYAFTEHGVAMLSSALLHSPRAVQVNIAIVRVFVKFREILASHTDLLRRVDELERKQSAQGLKVDQVFAAIKKLIEAPPQTPTPKRRIGFTAERDEK
jgi:hypothetical protein